MVMKKILPWIVANTCRLVVSATFVFSGLVKLIDPQGTAYKIHDYAMALDIGDWMPDSLPLVLAVVLALAEFCLGLYLMFGIRRRWTTRFILGLLCVFTPLTLWIALTDVVVDCGCFGEAVHLTNWQTFGKNIVLFGCAVVLCYTRRYQPRLVSEQAQWITSFFGLAYGAFIAGWGIYALPLIDFRAYHVGQNLREATAWPKDPEQLPEIADFVFDPYSDSLMDELDLGLAEDIVVDSGFTFLLVAPHLEEADDGVMDRINAVSDYAAEHGYRFVCVTASSYEAIEHWQDLTGAEYPFAIADDILLKTMVRSNPGLVLINDGVITAKWSSNTMPAEDDLTASDFALPTASEATYSPTTDWLHLILWLIVPLFLLSLTDRLVVGGRWWWHRKQKNSVQRGESLKYMRTFAPANPLIKSYEMRKKIVAGNWKMNLNLQEGVALATELKAALAAEKPNCDVVICTPFIHLATVAGIVDGTVIGLGAENCADKEKGAYTGEVSAAQVKSTGAQYVILGHSERRAYYGETAEILKEKVNLALANGLKVIFCIGEVLEEREAGKQNEVVGAQLADSLFDLTEEQMANIILAYEPVWAIGTGKTATAEQAQDMHAFIRGVMAGRFGEAVAENLSILYGGSCKPSNAREIFAKPDVDGGLIGGAALKCADFKGIIDAWS